MLNPFTGFNSLADPDDPDVVLTEQPGGALLRNDLRTREQQAISPQPQTFSGAPASEMKYRFNFDAPLLRSPHGKDTIYLAGNVIFQSADYGKSWEAISRDLTNHDVSKMGNVGGPISTDNSASEVYGTITALSESPAKRNVLWAGTDDGNVQVSVNGGGAWTNVAQNISGIPPSSPVSHIEASKENEQTAYVSFDRHMFDDMRPYIFKTTDAGKTWQSIVAGLPDKAFVWIVREDPRNASLLYAGTELGLYASFNRGSSWVPLHGKNMPWAIAVRDIFVHPATNDLIVATHGRSLWILDEVAPLQQLAGNPLDTGWIRIRPAVRFATRAIRFGFGDKTFTGPNPPYGALLDYYLETAGNDVRIQILDSTGSVLRTLPGPKGSGFHRIAWDLRYTGPKGQAGGGDRRGRGGPQGPQALPGTYTARLTVDGTRYDSKFEVALDPELHVDMSDLHKQLDVAREPRDMQSSVNGVLARVAAVRNSAPDVARQASALLTRPATLRSETGPRLKENLEALATMVDGVNAAPTQAQMKYFEELKTQFQDAMKQVNTLFGSAGAAPLN